MRSKDIKDLCGFAKYDTVHITKAAAGWMTRLKDAGKSFVDTLKDEVSPIKVTETGTKIVDKLKTGLKIAGWALSLISNGFDNYCEFKKREISIERAILETVSETLIDIGKGAAIAATIAGVAALVGASAPVAVVCLGTVGISFGLDWLTENVWDKKGTSKEGKEKKEEKGRKFTEWVSDSILDFMGYKDNSVAKAKNARAKWFIQTTGFTPIALIGT